jgi:hypothetical protein
LRQSLLPAALVGEIGQKDEEIPPALPPAASVEASWQKPGIQLGRFRKRERTGKKNKIEGVAGKLTSADKAVKH